MFKRFLTLALLTLVSGLVWSVPHWGQSVNASISGTVADPTGAVIPDAELTLTAVATGAVAKFASGPNGAFSFRNLPPGVYELRVTKQGFRDFVQRGIEVAMNAVLRVDVKLELGEAMQTVEVMANASPLNFETAEVKGGISPSTLQQLPLLVAGSVRSSGAFAILMPGVTTGSGTNAFDARINGGLGTGDEAIMDGVSMQQGMMNQTGMISMSQDFPMTPDMVSEMSVLTSSYEPQYGSTLSAQVVVESKSGTNEFHGALYEYHRNTALNARQFGIDKRPTDLEHDFGGNFGGPFKIGKRGIPFFWGGKKRSYFYVNLEGFRISGGVSSPTLSIPTLKNRRGDFSDWIDPDTGQLIPIYDPVTTRPLDPTKPLSPTNVTRDQFMGCDGKTPNVICPSRFANSLALKWLQYLPDPTRPGPLNNYTVPTPVPDVLLSHTNYVFVRGDHYYGDKDHFSVTVWYQGAQQNLNTALPAQIAYEEFTAPQFSFVDRFRWDHTFSPTVLNHFAFGYLDRNEGYGSINWLLQPEALPRIPGTATTLYPPVIQFSDDYATFGQGYGDNRRNRTTRQTYVFQDLLSWVKGKHTLKIGFEHRNLGENLRDGRYEGGTFTFGRGTTGLLGTNSGNPIASFLLEAADSAEVTYHAIGARYPRSRAWIAHFGDTWKLTPKLSINYGLRWDTFTPAREKYNRSSFFDPVGPNPGAGGRPGRLAFAGTGDLQSGESWGPAAFGRQHPEKTWWKGFAPRLGIAYGLNQKTVIRTGYGIFFTQAFYPGWEDSISTAGFTANLTLSSTLGGLNPAMILSQGFPIQDFIDQGKVPPRIDPAFRNGQDLQYKPFEANRRSYSQQWNLSIERQFGNNLTLNVAYVGNKGTRLPSTMVPLNALNPQLLSQYGEKLYDEFEEGQTELHGVPIPYAGWREQLGCSPSLAQALLPYPQYCSALRGMNENAGNSIYHSFQTKVEKRFSHGTFLLASYTISKLLTTSDQTQSEAMTWSGAHGVISPFERQRNKSLAIDDVPQVLSLALIYELPFGKGKRFLNGGGPMDKLLGGWAVSNVFRASSGIPFFFRSSTCNVPEQFRVGCIPAILPGVNPWAQAKGNFDPNQPLFNVSAFEPLSAFESFGYYGTGSRISNLRGFGFHNHDFGLIKNTRIREKVNLQIRAEFFNVWNWHIFTAARLSGYSDAAFGYGPFDTDISSPTFGMWNGAVSSPRNIQVAARIEF
jgi:hypothetical protein